jgi:ribosome-associated protein
MAGTTELVRALVRALDKHKGGNIRVLEVGQLTSIADAFVIAEGGSSTQVRALADYAEEELKQQGIAPLRSEGYRSQGWIVLDYGDVVLHVFHRETRQFYDLERLWKDGREIDIAEFLDNEGDDHAV